MKTSIQKAIEWVKNNNVNEENQAGDRLLVVDALDLTIFLIGLLPTERENIEQAFNAGRRESWSVSPSDYFKTNYSNEA